MTRIFKTPVVLSVYFRRPLVKSSEFDEIKELISFLVGTSDDDISVLDEGQAILCQNTLYQQYPGLATDQVVSSMITTLDMLNNETQNAKSLVSDIITDQILLLMLFIASKYKIGDHMSVKVGN